MEQSFNYQKKHLATAYGIFGFAVWGVIDFIMTIGGYLL